MPLRIVALNFLSILLSCRALWSRIGPNKHTRTHTYTHAHMYIYACETRTQIYIHICMQGFEFWIWVRLNPYEYELTCAWVERANEYVNNKYVNALEGLPPLRSFGCRVLVVEAARGGDVLGHPLCCMLSLLLLVPLALLSTLSLGSCDAARRPFAPTALPSASLP
jgi:hypothetical protein